MKDSFSLFSKTMKYFDMGVWCFLCLLACFVCEICVFDARSSLRGKKKTSGSSKFESFSFSSDRTLLDDE